MIDHALHILAQADANAVIEFLNQQDDPQKASSTYSELVKHLYWQDKNVPEMIVLARAGIGFALRSGAQIAQEDLSVARELRSQAKTIAYNLASFTWIGWDEPGIALTKADQRSGLDAAKLNLRLAFELEKGNLRISRGYWMKAAQLLAATDRAAARYGFAKAVVYADRAGARGDELIAHAFLLLVETLQDPGNAALPARLAEINAQFSTLEHGPMYVEQLETASRVFGARSIV